MIKAPKQKFSSILAALLASMILTSLVSVNASTFEVHESFEDWNVNGWQITGTSYSITSEANEVGTYGLRITRSFSNSSNAYFTWEHDPIEDTNYFEFQGEFKINALASDVPDGQWNLICGSEMYNVPDSVCGLYLVGANGTTKIGYQMGSSYLLGSAVEIDQWTWFNILFHFNDGNGFYTMEFNSEVVLSSTSLHNADVPASNDFYVILGTTGLYPTMPANSVDYDELNFYFDYGPEATPTPTSMPTLTPTATPITNDSLAEYVNYALYALVAAGFLCLAAVVTVAKTKQGGK